MRGDEKGGSGEAGARRRRSPLDNLKCFARAGPSSPQRAGGLAASLAAPAGAHLDRAPRRSGGKAGRATGGGVLGWLPRETTQCML